MLEPQNIARTVERLTAEGYAPWHPEVAGVNYAFIQSENAPLDARYVDGVLRLLPRSDRPQAVEFEAIAAMQATCRALAFVQATRTEAERNDPTIAGMARSMLANLLRGVGISVTIDGERVEDLPVRLAPRRGENQLGRGHRAAQRVEIP